MGNYTTFLMFENPRRGRQARNFTENDPKILDLKSSSEQIIFRKLSLGAPDWWACKLTSVNSVESLKLQVRVVSASFKLYNMLKTQREIWSFSKESLILRTLVNYSLH